jgi:hypothetical protein
MQERKKKVLALPGIELRLLGRPAHNLVSVPTELSQPQSY